MKKNSYADKKRRQAEGTYESPSSHLVVVTLPPEPKKPELEPEPEDGGQQNTGMPWTHFCAGTMVQRINDVWYVAGLTDSRFPDDVKLPGGTNENAPWEDKWKTLSREFGEEYLVQVDPGNCGQLVHRVLNEARFHTQYFFFVRHWQGKWREGDFQDTDGHVLTAKRLTLAEFWSQCFVGHRRGFQNAVRWIAREKLPTEPDFAAQAVAAGIIAPLT